MMATSASATTKWTNEYKKNDPPNQSIIPRNMLALALSLFAGGRDVSDPTTTKG